MATILLHNMMVEERIESDEIEDGSFYSSIRNEDNEEDEEENDLDNIEYNATHEGRIDKLSMEHWKRHICGQTIIIP